MLSVTQLRTEAVVVEVEVLLAPVAVHLSSHSLQDLRVAGNWPHSEELQPMRLIQNHGRIR
jgi:hypothetical protein